MPRPRFATWDDFNVWLEEQCRKGRAEILRDHGETIDERLQRDLGAIRPCIAPRPTSPDFIGKLAIVPDSEWSRHGERFAR